VPLIVRHRRRSATGRAHPGDSRTIWYVITRDEVIIDAAPDTVWDVYSDVERWPSWTASVTSVELLEGERLGPSSRVRIKQPRFPTLVWEVTELTPGTSWSWTTRSPGATTVATHRLEALGDGRTRVTQTIDQRGPLGVVVGLLTRRLTRRYLAMEAAGLKQRVERGGAPA
jgi:uncharacterized membrane protein